MWQLFLQTGDVETYLLFKQLENDVDETENNHENIPANITLYKTKM